jgi:hypothetical protein
MTMEKPKNTHGGRRKGSGRKRVAPVTVMKSVKLTPAQWALAGGIGQSKTGKPNAAAGIRRALDAWKFPWGSDI